MIEHSLWQHVAEFGLAIKRNWYWLLTAVPVLFYSARYVIGKKLDGDYMLRTEVLDRISESEEAFAAKLDSHEEREFARQDRSEMENKAAHRELRDYTKSMSEKIDHLTDVIIENMRSKK